MQPEIPSPATSNELWSSTALLTLLNFLGEKEEKKPI